MPVTNVHTLYAVDVDPITAANAIFIDQVTDFNVDTAIAEALHGADGAVDPTYVAVMGQAPRLRFTTSKLATLLAKVTNSFFINGIKIDSDAGVPAHDGLEAWFQKLVEGGTRAGATSHLKMTINEGLLIPGAISVNQGGVAAIPLDCIVTHDGTNAPIVLTANQTLPGSPSVSELFTLGPVKINGTLLDAVQSVSIDPGIQPIVAGADGAVWPTYAAIMGRQPMITITCFDALALNTFGVSGTAQATADSLIYLRKLTEGGGRVADATAEHISFSIDEGIITVENIGGGHGAPTISRVRIRPTWDGTNAILVINPATAIT